MRHHNSVLHQVLKHVPWARFEALVESHAADKHVRRLSTKGQLIALVYAQLSGAVSLRQIEADLSSHSARLYHLGAAQVRRSTLADANALRPAAVFEELLAALMAQVHRGLRKSLAQTLYLIDSTGLRLDARAQSWARFSSGVCGAKLHVVYDPDADQPVYAGISAANINDITAAKAMPIEPGATYVFDLGYYDYKWWAELDHAGCRIVTRLKKNTPLDLIEERKVPAAEADILRDRIGFLPKRQSYRRENPLAQAVREVTIRIDSGKTLRIFSNDLDATARQIADLYKRRWAIELFFRWIKHTLKITRFLGTSQNAVRIQVATALIAFLLLRLAQAAQNTAKSPLTFARLVRANLMHRRRIDQLIKPIPLPPQNQAQIDIQWPEI